jgi:hypothetical protein
MASRSAAARFADGTAKKYRVVCGRSQAAIIDAGTAFCTSIEKRGRSRGNRNQVRAACAFTLRSNP